jgi:hypothetical protein
VLDVRPRHAARITTMPFGKLTVPKGHPGDLYATPPDHPRRDLGLITEVANANRAVASSNVRF